jgi:signal peptidase II
VIPLFASAAVLFLLDQWSKSAARVHAADRGVPLGPFLTIRCVTGLKRLYTPFSVRAAMVLFWILALLSAIILRSSGFWFHSQTSVFGLGLALGGAAGNLSDILRFRYVVDFVDLRWWPVFNFADVGIIGGLLLAFWR